MLTPSAVREGRFPFSLVELDKLRGPIESRIRQLDGLVSDTLSDPQRATAYNQRLAIMEGLTQPGSVADQDNSGTRQSKGLRVEDFRPPATKRPRAGTNKGSPLAFTPDAKTPSAPSDSPLIPTQNSAKRPKLNQRKRQDAQKSATTPQDGNPSPTSARASGAMGPPPSIPPNALGIEVDAVQAELAQHGPFFKFQKALSGGDMSLDAYAAFQNASQEFRSSLSGVSSNTLSLDIGPAPSTLPLNFGSFTSNSYPLLASMANMLQAPPAASTDDEDFSQFLDLSGAEDVGPTPELYRISSNDPDSGESDQSPESIRTVASGSASGGGAGTITATTAWPIPPVPSGGTKERPSGTMFAIPQSPLSQSYNGALELSFGDDEEVA